LPSPSSSPSPFASLAAAAAAPPGAPPASGTSSHSSPSGSGAAAPAAGAAGAPRPSSARKPSSCRRALVNGPCGCDPHAFLESGRILGIVAGCATALAERAPTSHPPQHSAPAQPSRQGRLGCQQYVTFLVQAQIMQPSCMQHTLQYRAWRVQRRPQGAHNLVEHRGDVGGAGRKVGRDARVLLLHELPRAPLRAHAGKASCQKGLATHLIGRRTAPGRTLHALIMTLSCARAASLQKTAAPCEPAPHPADAPNAGGPTQRRHGGSAPRAPRPPRRPPPRARAARGSAASARRAGSACPAGSGRARWLRL